MIDVCLIWSSSIPETTLIVCRFYNHDFSICLTRRCQKELQCPVLGMRLSWNNYVWCLFDLGFRHSWNNFDSLLPFQPRLQHMFDRKMPKRTPKPCCRDAIVPGQLFLMFCLIWGSGTPATNMIVCRFYSQLAYIWPKDAKKNFKAL